MATLDWSQWPAVESVPGRRSGAWVFRGTRMPVSAVFENLQDMSVDELIEEFGVTREQVPAVFSYAWQLGRDQYSELRLEPGHSRAS